MLCHTISVNTSLQEQEDYFFSYKFVFSGSMRFTRDGSEMMLEILIPEQAPLRFDAADVLSQSEGKLRVRLKRHIDDSICLSQLG